MKGEKCLHYSFDLLYDIKTKEELEREVEYLAHRLASILLMCRKDAELNCDEYVKKILNIPSEIDE